MEDIYIGKEFLQHCGDTLRVLEKTNQKRREKSNYLYRAIFLKYSYEVLTEISNIKEGKVNNPQIEIVEFKSKVWFQHCGDTLRVLEKTNQKNINSSKGEYLWKCEFQKYPYIVYKTKGNIIKGTVVNPRIEEEEFIGKVFKQNCGDFLKVLRKTNQQLILGSNFLYECEFINYPYKGLFKKTDILRKNIDNPNLPWKSKERLKEYIEENYKEEKPTLVQLSQKLGISRTHLSSIIITFGLQKYIHYYLKEESLEGELQKYISCIYKGEIKSNLSRELNGKEIDIYLPDLKIGFEFNGNYWHSDEFKLSNYHQEKSLLAKEKGIRLIHIWEWEWIKKEEVTKGFIKSKCNIFEKKIGARQCKIKELKYKEYSQFCNKNHLQGEAGARVKLGLFYKNELIQIMSFGSPRFTDKYEWEIIRECSKLGWFIIGGKEKLWKYFLKNYNPNNCISYCDFSKFIGDSYLKLGFKFKQLNHSGFVWYDKDTNEVFWRNPYNHKVLKNKNYLKLYDCGQLVFEWFKEG